MHVTVRLVRAERRINMFGFIIGTLCLIGLIAVLRRHRGWGGYGVCGRVGSRRGRGGRFLRYVFERLETTPGQEKAVVAAVGELREAVDKMRDEMKVSRADLARVVQAPSFEPAALRDLFARHDGMIDDARKATVIMLGKVHEALDERQRKALAELVETGPHFFRRSSACHCICERGRS